MFFPKIDHRIIVPEVVPPKDHHFHLSYSSVYGLELSLVTRTWWVLQHKVRTTRVMSVIGRTYTEDIARAATLLKAGAGVV